MQHCGGPSVFYGMGAIVCDVRDFNGKAEVQSPGLFSRGVNPQPERRCPQCDAIVYSRRHLHCGVCCEPLPANCIFSAEEARSVELRLNEERHRHRKWLHRFSN